LKEDITIFRQKISERTLCGALMLALYEVVKNTEFSNYYIDVEYNRNRGSKLKTIKKKTIRKAERVVQINCDLIMHSRCENVALDNLIAIEMKKSTEREENKDSDRERLECLTSDSFDDIWSYDGKSLPEHVCRYMLGVYCEINFTKKEIAVEYYKKGICYKKYKINY
jgi:hypothetical protein